MQIGVVVTGFQDVDGVLVMMLKVQFNHPDVPRGEIGGSVPFATNAAQATAAARQWIAESYGVVVPANADVRVIGL